MDLNRYYNNMLRILVKEQNLEGLTSQEIQLLDALAKIADMWRWPEEFKPRNTLILTLTQWGSVSKVKRVRASLVKKGFIFFKARKRKAGIYSFTNKITGNNTRTIKNKDNQEVSYSTSKNSKIVRLYEPQSEDVVEERQLKRVDAEEQSKADHLHYWRPFVEAVKPAIDDADVAQQESIRDMYRELDIPFITELIYRFNRIDWTSKRAPAPYLIKSMMNELKNQQTLKTAQVKPKLGDK